MKGKKGVVKGELNFDDLKALTDISELDKLHEHVRNDLRFAGVVPEIEFLNPSNAVGLEKEKL